MYTQLLWVFNWYPAGTSLPASMFCLSTSLFSIRQSEWSIPLKYKSDHVNLLLKPISISSIVKNQSPHNGLQGPISPCFLPSVTFLTLSPTTLFLLYCVPDILAWETVKVVQNSSLSYSHLCNMMLKIFPSKGVSFSLSFEFGLTMWLALPWEITKNWVG